MNTFKTILRHAFRASAFVMLLTGVFGVMDARNTNAEKFGVVLMCAVLAAQHWEFAKDLK